ncbi:MAG: MFS transporter [Ignavibacteriales bacterium]|nr:MFS transporter [Ignavibacteriales bacterium]
MTEGALFLTGASFVAPQTVLPALLSKLGGNNLVMGTVVVITWVGLYIPQVFAARFSQAQPWKKKWAIRWGIFQRLNVAAVVITLLFAGSADPNLIIFLILFFFASHQIMMGISTPFWFDMFAKLTASDLRGRLAGLKTAIAGIGAIAGSFLLSWLLTIFQFPLGYAVAFSVTFFLQLLSILMQFSLVEKVPSSIIKAESFREYFSQIKTTLLTDHNFRNFLTSSVPLTLAVMPAGFFTVYGLKTFGLTDASVGMFTMIMVLGQGTGALMNGFIGDHYGNKIALVSSASFMLFASFLGMISHSITIYYGVFFLMGMNLGSELMIRHNLAMEYAPIEKRATYIAIMNMILSPFYVSGLLAGWISEVWGYKLLFTIAIVFSIVGIISIFFRVTEPRSVKKIL